MSFVLPILLCTLLEPLTESLVVLGIVLGLESFEAVAALEWSVARVHHHMTVQVVFVLETLPAHLALGQVKRHFVLALQVVFISGWYKEHFVALLTLLTETPSLVNLDVVH